MEKNHLSINKQGIGRIHITSATILDNIIKPRNYRVTSDVAINGATIFELDVLPVSATDNDILQRQIQPSTHLIFERYYDGSTFTAWFCVSQGAFATAPVSAFVGYSYYNTTSNKPLWLKSATQTKAVVDLTVTAFPTASGNVTITLNGVAFTVALSTTTETTIALTAAKILAQTYTGWVKTAITNGVRFTRTTYGAVSTPTYGAASTGSTATIATSTQGADYIWVDATGTTV